jgi:hypothetical protein
MLSLGRRIYNPGPDGPAVSKGVRAKPDRSGAAPTVGKLAPDVYPHGIWDPKEGWKCGVCRTPLLGFRIADGVTDIKLVGGPRVECVNPSCRAVNNLEGSYSHPKG